jgi:hypothetical protein
MPNHNLDFLARAARLLEPLLDELVYVGGCTTALHIITGNSVQRACVFLRFPYREQAVTTSGMVNFAHNCRKSWVI